MSELPLRGARIALTGTRKAQETADFVRRLGGIPIVAPALDTTPLSGGEVVDSGVALAELLKVDVALVIFLTGIGARALVQLAESAGRDADLRAALTRSKVVARGPKALGALKGAGIRVDWMPREATVAAILAGLDQFDLAGRAVAIQWSGFIDHSLRAELHRRAAGVVELDLYRHVPPANETPVLDLIDSIHAADIDFLTFTSAIGVREFFALAERHGRDDDVLTALRAQSTVPVAVGPVTASALAEAGVAECVVPPIHTTGGMLRAIEDWISSHSLLEFPKIG